RRGRTGRLRVAAVERGREAAIDRYVATHEPAESTIRRRAPARARAGAHPDAGVAARDRDHDDGGAGMSAMDRKAHAVALCCKGFLDDTEGLRLHELAAEQARLGPVLEIGSYCGKSACYLGAGVRAGGGVLVCVDHHRGSEENQRGELYHDPALFDHEAGKMD